MQDNKLSTNELSAALDLMNLLNGINMGNAAMSSSDSKPIHYASTEQKSDRQKYASQTIGSGVSTALTSPFAYMGGGLINLGIGGPRELLFGATVHNPTNVANIIFGSIMALPTVISGIALVYNAAKYFNEVWKDKKETREDQVTVRRR